MKTKTTITATQIKTLNNLHDNGRMLTGCNGRPGCNSKSCKALVRKGLVDIVDGEPSILPKQQKTWTPRYFEINDAGRSCITK